MKTKDRAAAGAERLWAQIFKFLRKGHIMLKREYPERPIVGVGAVIMDDQVVLLVRRKQEPGKGRWSLPGGVVKVGESLKEAVKREVLEEVSIKIEIGGLVGVFDRIIHDRQNLVQFHYVLVDYWGWIISGHPKPGSDISAVRSVPLTELEGFEIGSELKDTILKAAEMRDMRFVIKE